MAELKKTLQRRNIKLQKLIHQRDRLRMELSKLDKLIVEIGGVGRDATTEERFLKHNVPAARGAVRRKAARTTRPFR